MSQPASSDELAAAMAAIALLIAEETDDLSPDPADRTGWRDATRLATAHLPPARTAVRPSWRTIERIRGGD